MKRPLATLAALVIIALAAFIFLHRQQSTLDPRNAEFACPDTASVSKISLQKASNTSIVLLRSDTAWIVNNHYLADQQKVNHLLRILKNLSFKAPVSQQLQDSLLLMLRSADALRITVESKKSVLREFSIGHVTDEKTGTYMLLKGGQKPVIMHVPGENSDLNAAFSQNLLYWRNKNLLHLAPHDIATIGLTYAQEAKSLQIEITNGAPRLTDGKRQAPPCKPDPEVIADYLGRFGMLNYETTASGDVRRLKDSLNQCIPLCNLHIRTQNGDQEQIAFHEIPVTPYSDATGQQVSTDPDRLYAVVSSLDDVVIVSYIAFAPVLKPITYFCTSD